MRGARQGARRCSADGPARTCTARSSSTTTGSPRNSGRLDRRDRAPTATTRCAATSSRSTLELDGDTHQGRVASRAGLRDLGRLGFADDRGVKGKTAARRPSSCSSEMHQLLTHAGRGRDRRTSASSPRSSA